MEIIKPFQNDVFMFMPPDPTGLCEQITAVLLEESRTTPGIARSNKGAWHSVPDLTLRKTEPFLAFFSFLTGHIHFCTTKLAESRNETLLPHRWAAHAWGTVMNKDDYMTQHHHADSHWSAVWYADVGDESPSNHPDAGSISFTDPRGAITPFPSMNLRPSVMNVRPKTGMLLVFPGFLSHCVYPYLGDKPRVSVACNFRMELTAPK
jgi:uncharacterized protein (TIGR02466 family)